MANQPPRQVFSRVLLKFDIGGDIMLCKYSCQLVVRNDIGHRLTAFEKIPDLFVQCFNVLPCPSLSRLC